MKRKTLERVSVGLVLAGFAWVILAGLVVCLLLPPNPLAIIMGPGATLVFVGLAGAIVSNTWRRLTEGKTDDDDD